MIKVDFCPPFNILFSDVPGVSPKAPTTTAITPIPLVRTFMTTKTAVSQSSMSKKYFLGVGGAVSQPEKQKYLIMITRKHTRKQKR